MDQGIRRLFAFNFLTNAFFGIPVIFLFFDKRGLTLEQAFALQGIFSLAVVILEVPSGYLSDRWSRKKTVCLGSLLVTSGWLLMIFASSFILFAIAHVLIAAGLAFHSGTIEAMLCDHLHATNQHAYMESYLSKLHNVGFTAQAIAAISSGLLVMISIETALWVNVFAKVAALLVATALIDVRQAQATKGHGIAEKPVPKAAIASIVCMGSGICCLIWTLTWSTQPLLISLKVLPFWWGIIATAGMVGNVIACHIGQRLSDRFSTRNVLAGISATLAICFLATGYSSSTWCITLLIGGSAMWGAMRPLISSEINLRVDNRHRAMINSLFSLASRILFAASCPIVGRIADMYGIMHSLVIAGWGGLVFSVASHAVYRYKTERP